MSLKIQISGPAGSGKTAFAKLLENVCVMAGIMCEVRDRSLLEDDTVPVFPELVGLGRRIDYVVEVETAATKAELPPVEVPAMSITPLKLVAVPSSEVFTRLPEEALTRFNEAEHDVSFGDASHTLVNQATFRKMLENAITDEDLRADVLRAFREVDLPPNVFIDLES